MIFTKFINRIKENVSKEQGQEEEIFNKDKTKFSIKLRKYSEELNLINEINDNPSKLFDMSIEELENVLQAIHNRRNFLNQRILELETELSKISKKDD